MNEPNMVDDLVSWPALFGYSAAVITILASAFFYEHIRNPKILWAAIAAIIGLELYVTHLAIAHLENRLSAPTNLLVPADDPDPATLDQIITSKIPPEVLAQLPADIERELEEFRPTTQLGDSELKTMLSRPGTLKIFLGTSVGYTTKESQVAIRMAGRDLLIFHKSPAGITIDAKILDESGIIVAEIDKNQFFINQNNVFRIERPDSHSLVVHDRTGERVLTIRYLNPNAVSIQGVFQVPGRPPLKVLSDQMLFGGRPFLSYSVLGDSGGSLIAIQ